MKEWLWAHRLGMLYLWEGVGFAAAVTIGIHFAMENGVMESLLPAIGFVLWTLAGGSLLSYNTARQANKAVGHLYHFCDPEPMLHWEEEEVAYYARSCLFRKNQDYLNVCIGNQAVALNALGRYEEAMALQCSADTRRMKVQTRLLYYTNSAAMHINLRLFSQAEADIEQARNLLPQVQKQVPLQMRSLQATIKDTQIKLSLTKGETPCEDAEETLLESLDHVPVEFSRVNRHYELAQLYLKEKRFSEAREHLEYVVAHGNKLYIRTKAEELLRTLPVDGEGAPA